jgi:hypothetical protein
LKITSPGNNFQNILATWQEVTKIVRQGAWGHRDIMSQCLGFQVVEEKLVAILLPRGITPEGLQTDGASGAVELQALDN